MGRWRVPVRFFAISLLAAWVVPGVYGQPVVPSDENLTLSEPVFLPPDRQVVRMLDTARQLLDQRRYSEAVRALAWLLNAEEDYFFQADPGTHPEEGRTYRSLKNEARHLIGELPSVARDSYELQFGIAAQRHLADAIRDGDIEALADVTRGHFHTKAGYRAMVLLGRHHMNQGRPLAAALCLNYVYQTRAAAEYEPELSVLLACCWQRAGDAEKAKRLLSELKRKYPDASVEIAGKPVRIFDRDDQALTWLAQLAGSATSTSLPHSLEWVMFRGNASRNGLADGGRPVLLRARWRQRVPSDVETEEVLAEYQERYGDQSMAAIPAFQPLALNNLVLMRTPLRLVAVDFETGKLVWQVESDDRRSPVSESSGQQFPDDIKGGLVERAWVDKTFGSMSSDGDRVFVLEEFGLRPGGQQRIVIDPVTGRRRLHAGNPYNVLAAYDVAQTQGKRVWSVGGPSEGNDELSQAFFLGPPLPMQGRLYALAELKGEVRLVVLDGRSGRHLWSQQLAVVPQDSRYERHRRTSGISPSFAEGVLVCPTGVGAIVAVDLTTRSLMWGYQYPEEEDKVRVRQGWGVRVAATPLKLEEIWADSCAVIDGDRIVVTPAESRQMHCLSLTDGDVQWRIEREEYAYLACVHSDAAIVVGRDRVAAIDMATGKMVDGWPLNLPKGSVPSGRGYLADGHYYLSLNSPAGGEVARIDLAGAKIVSRARSGNGTIPGNLICYQGQVISQGTDWLQCFYQLDPLREKIADRSKVRPEDPWVLMRRGELLMDEGKAGEAVALFRSAREQYAEILTAAETPQNRDARTDAYANSVYARQLLLEGLLEGLRKDYIASRASLPEVEQLIQRPDERVTYLRILAHGQELAGQRQEALATYMKLVEASLQSNPLVSIDNTLAVRLDRWLRSRMQKLRDDLTEDERGEFDAEVARRQVQAVSAEGVSALRNFQSFFGSHELADAVKSELADRLKPGGHHMERIGLLQELTRSSDAARRRAAVAQLAELYGDVKHYGEASHYYEQLRDQWPDEICLNGKTGRELYDALPDTSPVRQVAGQAAWPVGAVKMTQGASGPQRLVSYQPSFPLQILSRRNPLRQPTTIVVDQRQRYMVFGRDGNGNHRWSVSLLDGDNRNRLMINAGLSCGRMDGPLLIMSVGHQIMAINTLQARTAGNEGSAILWRQDVSQHVSPAQVVPRSSNPTDPPPWGDNAPNQYQQRGALARLGPITPGGVTFVRNRDLVSIDPYTGDDLWIRKGVARDAELFGDDDYVLIAAPNQTDAELVTAMDGSLIRRVKLPPPTDRWTTLGRKILTWTRSKIPAGSRQLALYDPVVEKNVWTYTVAKGSKGEVIEDDQVAILQPDGRFVVLDVATGDVVLQQTLEPTESLKGIYVIRSATAYVVVTNRGASYGDAKMNYQPMPQGNGSAFVTGAVYSLDRKSGAPLWQIPATVKQQGLVLGQPSELPVIVFARRTTDRQKRSYYLSFLFIDKRTGRLVVPPKNLSNRDYNFELAGDPIEKTVTVFFQNRGSNVTLKFSDDPVAPGPPIQVEGERVVRSAQFQSTWGAVLKAMGKAAEAAGGLPVGKDAVDDLFGEDE